MNLLGVLKRALGLEDLPPPQPAMAQLTIITTESLERSSESRSQRARD
jgi:hypothetical protein